MSSFTFSQGHPFPASTVVSAYEDRGQAHTGQPSGTAVSTGTVSSPGALTISGLDEGVRYFAVALVGGQWVWVSFSIPTYPDLPADGAMVLGSDLAEVYAAVRAEAPLNPRWPEYGAVGDGSADDTKAIADALVAARGEAVLFDAGDYKTSPFVIRSSLRGQDKGNTRIFNKDTTGQNFAMVRGDDITVEDIEIDGVIAAQNVHTGTGLTAGGASVDEKSARFTLRDAIVRPSGFGCVVVWDVDGFTVDDNDLYATYDDALDFLEGARHGGAKGNRIHVLGGAIGITADTNAGVPPYDITIGENTIVLDGATTYTGSQWAIMLLECLDITVIGNPIDCSAGTPNGGIRCVAATANPKRFSILGNPIRGGAGCTDGGVSIDASQSPAASANRELRALIAGNPISGFSHAGAAGVRNKGGSRVRVAGNPISGCDLGVQGEVATGVDIANFAIVGNPIDGGTDQIKLISGGSGAGSVKLAGNDGGVNIASGWTVDQSGLVVVAAARAANNSVFIDSADGKLKFKDSGGTANALY